MPRPHSSHQTVRDGIAIARTLRDRLTPATVTRTLTLALPHLGGAIEVTPSLALTLAGHPHPTGREKLTALLVPALEKVHQPALHDRLIAVLRGMESEPDAVSLAEAYATLRDALGRHRRVQMPRMTQEMAQAVGDQAKTCVDGVARLLGGTDFPDLPALSMDLLKLEGLTWLVEVLGDRKVQQEIAYMSRRLARLTLQRATATIDAFLTGRDMMAMYDNAAVISQVDNLLVVAGRILDATASQEEERTAFVETADEQALGDFLKALGLLSDALFAMLDKGLSRHGANTQMFVRGLANQLDCLLRFCRALRHPHRLPVVENMQSGLERRLRLLAARACEVLDHAVADEAAHAASALVNAEEVAAVLERLGFEMEVAAMRLRIRIAHRALRS